MREYYWILLDLALGVRLGDKKNNVDVEQVPLHNWETSSILGTIVKILQSYKQVQARGVSFDRGR
jgi:hypothetical protein